MVWLCNKSNHRFRYRSHSTIRILTRIACEVAQPCATPAQKRVGWPGTSRVLALWKDPGRKDASDSVSEIAIFSTHHLVQHAKN